MIGKASGKNLIHFMRISRSERQYGGTSFQSYSFVVGFIIERRFWIVLEAVEIAEEQMTCGCFDCPWLAVLRCFDSGAIARGSSDMHSRAITEGFP